MLEFIERLADETNLLTLLKFLQNPQEKELLNGKIEDSLVVGGRLKTEILFKISQQRSVIEAANLLQETVRSNPIRKAQEKYRINRQISEFEKELRLDRQRWMAGLISRDPLGIGVPIGYTALKEIEIKNIRLITKFIQLGFSSNEIIMNLEKITMKGGRQSVWQV